jgi:GDPmannose 4,6-dehydratase
MKRALITGITGQDGAYLSKLLLDKGYEVHGLIRRASTVTTERIQKYIDEYPFRYKLHYGDITDSLGIVRLIEQIHPQEIYHLAAQSHVGVSFEIPEYTAQTDGLGTLRILEAVRILGLQKVTKIYQASTSELFGKVQEIPQKETTPFYPRSPYGVAKLYAYWITKHYREAYDMFACNGILFNHESPLRGTDFVTRKISLAAAQWAMGNKVILKLGNLNAQRDWGYAPEYVEAMWLMLQQEKADDFVIATGTTHSVREFVEEACKVIGKTVKWHGKNENEYGVDQQGNTLVHVDASYFRPAEVDLLIGDASKAHTILGWKARTDFKQLVKIMVEADRHQLQTMYSNSCTMRSMYNA